MSELKTRDQKYAAVIYEQVIKLEPEKEKDWVKDYGRLANHLPVLVKKAGLAEALSFAAKDADKKKGHEQFLQDLQITIGGIIEQKDLDLMKRSLHDGLTDYLWLTQQVMTALHWYKRFAQSVLDVKQDDEGRGR